VLCVCVVNKSTAKLLLHMLIVIVYCGEIECVLVLVLVYLIVFVVVLCVCVLPIKGLLNCSCTC